MVAETEVQRQLNPLIDDYGYAVERARAEQELLNAAQKAGKQITPALRSEIAGLADQYALATVAAAKLNEAQGDIRRKAEEAAEFNKDLLRGFVDGFIEGKKAADIFANALKKVGDRLLDMAFNAAFDAKGGGGFLGSLLGGIFGGGKSDPWSGLRLAGGGTVRGPGGPTGDKIPAMLSDGEHVTRAAMVKKYGPLLEAINTDRLPHLADGGFVSPRLPNIPKPTAANNNAMPSITFAPAIDARGASVEAVARLEQVLAKQQRDFSANVVATVRTAQKRRVL